MARIYKQLAKSQKNRIKRRDRYTCVWCGSRKDLTIDHKIPRCQGGSDEDENLQVLCWPCNKAKGSTLTYEIVVEATNFPDLREAFVPDEYKVSRRRR